MDERTKKILALSEAGKSQQQIAAVMRLSQTRVGQVLRTVPGWKCGRHWTEERKQRAIAEYKRLQSVEQVAKVMKSSRGRIRAVLRAAGITILPCKAFAEGQENPSWNGGFMLVGGYLYRRVPDHPNATQHGYVAEHRYVMSQHLKRALCKGEVVHHINGDPTDNRLENLQLFPSNAEHLRHELKGRVPKWTPDGKARMHRRNHP